MRIPQIDAAPIKSALQMQQDATNLEYRQKSLALQGKTDTFQAIAGITGGVAQLVSVFDQYQKSNESAKANAFLLDYQDKVREKVFELQMAGTSEVTWEDDLDDAGNVKLGTDGQPIRHPVFSWEQELDQFEDDYFEATGSTTGGITRDDVRAEYQARLRELTLQESSQAVQRGFSDLLKDTDQRFRQGVSKALAQDIAAGNYDVSFDGAPPSDADPSVRSPFEGRIVPKQDSATMRYLTDAQAWAPKGSIDSVAADLATGQPMSAELLGQAVRAAAQAGDVATVNALLDKARSTGAASDQMVQDLSLIANDTIRATQVAVDQRAAEIIEANKGNTGAQLVAMKDYVSNLPQGLAAKWQTWISTNQRGFLDETFNRQYASNAMDLGALQSQLADLMSDAGKARYGTDQDLRTQHVDKLIREIATVGSAGQPSKDSLKAGYAMRILQLQYSVKDNARGDPKLRRAATNSIWSLGLEAAGRGIDLTSEVNAAMKDFYSLSPDVQKAIDGISDLLVSPEGIPGGKSAKNLQSALAYVRANIYDFMDSGGPDGKGVTDAQILARIPEVVRALGSQKLAYLRDRALDQGNLIAAVGTLNRGEMDALVNYRGDTLDVYPAAKANIDQVVAFQVDALKGYLKSKYPGVSFDVSPRVAEDGSVMVLAKQPGKDPVYYSWKAADDNRSMTLRQGGYNDATKSMDWWGAGYTYKDAAPPGALPQDRISPERFAMARAALSKAAANPRYDAEAKQSITNAQSLLDRLENGDFTFSQLYAGSLPPEDMAWLNDALQGRIAP